MPMVQQVPVAQFAQWRDAQGQLEPLVLDVREPWEVQTASVRPNGFELMVIAMGDIPSRLNQLPKDRPIACLCHHGMRSYQVAEFLAGAGFERLFNLDGGIAAWAEEVDPQMPQY